jgi:hypothetical protein
MYLFVKIYQLKLYRLYNDLYNNFDDLVFYELKALETFINKKLSTNWCVELSGEEVNCLVIEVFGSKYILN